MMDKLERIQINSPRPIISGIQRISEKDEDLDSNDTVTDEEQDEDDDEYYLYDEDPPPYDIAEKLKEINSALSREIIPQGYEERQRKVIFRENPVEIEIPPTPNYSTDDEDDGYGDSTETSDDLPDQTGTNSDRPNNSPIKICQEFADKQKLGVDLSQLLGPASGPATSSPNSVAEEINFLFQCFTKLSLQNSSSQPVQTQIAETPNLPNSPINENEPFLFDSHTHVNELPEVPPSTIVKDSSDVPNNSFEEASKDNHLQSERDDKDFNEINHDSNHDNIQSDAASSDDKQSQTEEDAENVNNHSKTEEEVKETGGISKLTMSSPNTTESSENYASDNQSTNYSDSKEIIMTEQPKQPLSCSSNDLQKPKGKCSTTLALLKWKRAMRQLHNVRQIRHRPTSQSISVPPQSNTEIENETSTHKMSSKPDAVSPGTNKHSMDIRNIGQRKKKLLLTRSSTSTPALFTDKTSTNFEETMVMASQGRFRMMKTEDFQSSASKLSENAPRYGKMAAGRPKTSLPRRPENKARITPSSTQHLYKKNMTNNSVKSKALTVSQYPSPYRPYSVSWHKEERLDDVQRQQNLRGFSGTTFRLTPEQKAEKERKLQTIAQERQQKLERARQEKLKRKQEVETAFKDWLRCKKMQEPITKKPAVEDEKTERNINHHRVEKSGSPAFQDWIKRKKMQKMEELRIAEIKRKVEEKMLYIRKHEDNEKAFKTWLQTKSRETNLSSLRRKSSAASHFGSMSKWRTDNFFANYREF